MQDPAAHAFLLSPQQRRTWLLEQAGESCVAQGVMIAEGDLDFPALEQAVRSLAESHEILRTAFRRRVGMKVPFQILGGAADPLLRPLAMSGSDPLQGALEIEARDGFDLESGPVLRVGHLALDEGRHGLIFTLPALCADAASIVNLFEDLINLYASGETGKGEPVQYVDFIDWENGQKEERSQEEAEAFRGYWKERGRLAGAVVCLPLEGQWSWEHSERQAGLIHLPATVAAQAEEILGAGPEALPSCLQAGWHALLARLSCRSETLVAAAFSGRGMPDLESAVGPYSRSLPTMARCEPDRSFEALAREVQRERAGAAQRQYGFEWQETGSAVQESLPLPYAGFEFLAAVPAREAGGITFRPVSRHAKGERFKIVLCCAIEEDRVQLALRHSGGERAQAEVERVAGWLAQLLEDAFADPATPVGQLRLLSVAERSQILFDLAQGRRDPSPSRCVHELFEEQAALQPGAPAVVYENLAVSFGELNARANRLARHLRRLGVGPEIVAGLVLGRSSDLLTAMLGVLKAGGAYAVMDPDQPRRRLEALLDVLRPGVVLTHSALADRLPDAACRILFLDQEKESLARESSADPERLAAPESLAYVVFTSGSTGIPKGVAVEHRQLSNYLLGILPRLDLPEGASLATVSTFAADLGNTAIFPALAVGGCLHVVSVQRATDAAGFADYFERHAVDALKIVPSHLDALLSSAAPEKVLPRRCLVLGGEASSWDLVARIRAAAPDLRLFNHYGPSETTVGVATWLIGEPDGFSASVPIGVPFPNTSLQLLDAWLEPVPAGLAGDLYIGGLSLSRGYLGRPEATAERFMPDPFSTEPGARLYRSGDRARRLPGGEIEFLGRGDKQVKYHGFRIELEEVRTALNRHRQIRDSIVVMRRDSAGRDNLVCYYLSRQELEVNELRQFLGESLLEETLPNVFVHLQKLPLTLNGKINHEALPGLDDVRLRQRRALVAPRTPSEQTLVAIWSEVLGIDRISVTDSFFELGGHSLLAARVISRVQDTFDLEVPLRSLFDLPTIEGFATVIDSGRWDRKERLPLDDGLLAGGAATVLSFDQQLAELESCSDDDARTLLDGNA